MLTNFIYTCYLWYGSDEGRLCRIILWSICSKWRLQQILYFSKPVQWNNQGGVRPAGAAHAMAQPQYAAIPPQQWPPMGVYSPQPGISSDIFPLDKISLRWKS